MKRLATTMAAALMLACPAGFAQSDASATGTPEQSQASPSAIEFALAGFHINILENSDGGAVSVTGPEGQTALMAFIDPAAGEAALAAVEDQEVSVAPVPLAMIMQNWDGPIVFESSQAEIDSAASLVEEDVTFLAPVFFVTTDGKETRMKTPEGMIVPILPSFADAETMAARLAENGIEESKIDIVPIELAAVLQQISTPEAPVGYRVYTHPGTVDKIEAAAPKEQN
ncbi:MAG: hypothetical protein WA989_06810 [Henriciella sp.]|uniref:hypothetical protein n=1 Tax=Henriciella sp. TaxID=1968823 RepID=UPI003C707079